MQSLSRLTRYLRLFNRIAPKQGFQTACILNAGSFFQKSSFYFASKCSSQSSSPQPALVNSSQNITSKINHKDFYIEQLYTPCLAHYSYYVESDGEVAIIDPLRESKPYLDLLAQRKGKSIKYILESHFHADFVSGHVSLAEKTGADIIYGPTAQAQYKIRVCKDEEVLKLGKVEIKVLHTPGHTMESSCFLLTDADGKPHSVFTGDTVFLGDVGRPDLAVKQGVITAKDLANHLFDSTRNKIMSLPDDVVILPSHGQGSPCGKNIGAGHMCSVGNQKKVNYALNENLTRQQFIDTVTSDLPRPPQYFFFDATMNRKGYTNTSDLDIKNISKLTSDEVHQYIKNNIGKIVILDCRDNINDGIIPTSINIGLSMPFSIWAGTLIPTDKKLIIVADKGKEEQAARRLYRIGYDSIVGYLDGGFDAWKSANKPINKITFYNAQQTKTQYEQGKKFVDVRSVFECKNGKLKGSTVVPLSEIDIKKDLIPKDEDVVIYCRSGARAKVAYSILQNFGYNNLTLSSAGFESLSKEGIPSEK